VGGAGAGGSNAAKRNYTDLERAIDAFRKGRLDAETAARQAGMGYRAFLEELKHRGFEAPAIGRTFRRS
jgi:predicted HTH domain antitoxin